MRAGQGEGKEPHPAPSEPGMAEPSLTGLPVSEESFKEPMDASNADMVIENGVRGEEEAKIAQENVELEGPDFSEHKDEETNSTEDLLKAAPKVRVPGMKRRAAASDDGDESAYSGSDESAYDESEESYSSAESEEYESASDEDYSDEEEYGRPRRGRPARAPRGAPPPPGAYYNQWAGQNQQQQMMYMMMQQQQRQGLMRPMMPMGVPMLAPRPLPPLVNAAMPTVVRAMNAQGGVRPTLTAANLQEIARETVAMLAGGAKGVPGGAANAPVPPAEVPKEGEAKEGEGEQAEQQEAKEQTPEVEKKEEAQEGEKPPATAPSASNEEQIKATVSDEIKQNLARMLSDPQYKAALMQQLYMNQVAKMMAQGQQPPQMNPMLMMRPPQMMPGMMMPPYSRPVMTRPPAPPKHKSKRVRQKMRYEGDDGDAPIAARRQTRSSARKVDFSKLYEEEEEVDTTIEKYAEDQDDGSSGSSSRAVKKVVLSLGSKDDLSDIKPELKAGSMKRGKKKAAYSDEGEGEFNFDDEEDGGSGTATPESDEPTVNKILSHRVTADGQEEFLVKFNGLSYLHVDWISKEEMLEAKMGGMRVKKFMSKPLSEHHYDDRHPFNPDYLQIDRVIYGWDHPTLEDPSVMSSSYLVKWKSLPYSEATWEKIETLRERCPDVEDRVADWRKRPALESRRDPRQLRIGQRPDRASWQAMPESPVYKQDNTLRSYQLEGVNWLVYCWINKQSCIIADEMGLGKTVQSVAFVELLQKKFYVPGPFLVVAPLSTVPHWEREFQAWTDLNVLVYHGTVASRDLMHEHEFYYKDEQDRIIPDVYKFDVLITTYEMALAGFDTLQPIIWRAGIFDEAHRLKNRGSKAAEVLSLFRLEHKVLLTGTPLQNNLEELFALLHFLQPQRFASEEDFLEEYGDLQKSEDVARLQELLRPLMLRRLKEDVEKSIPVKEETVIEVELTSLQKSYYRAILERNFAFLAKGARGNNAPNLVNTMMELRKCCIHPYLIKGAEERILTECHAQTHDDAMHCMIQASGKLVLVDKLLKRLREQGHKVLIFSQMTRCLDLLSDFLAYRGYPFERIDGAVKGEDRQAAIDRYCAPGSDSFVFLLCTRAGGVGINLTVADTVVIYDSDWNPQNDLQAQARCHRIGQQKSVKVYRLITRNTYEREMFDKAGLKLGLDRAILQRMGNSEEASGFSGAHAPQLSKKEVETLLKKGAYGVLMEGDDDDSRRFCEEDIDSILSRRTQVIRHGDAAGEKNETSLFSKATFAATADDYDIDLDDPNFWELWAKRLNMNPKEMLAGSGQQSLDEPRIRRQAKRLRTEELRVIEMSYRGEDEAEQQDKPGEARLWSTQERNELLDLLLRFGPNRLSDRILPAFEGRRSRNDLVACMRSLIRFCLEHSEGDGPADRNFREDCEKLLLSSLDFEREQEAAVVDAATGNIDMLAAAELDEARRSEGATPSSTPAAKGDRPWPSATRQQCAEYASFLKGAPAGWLDALKAIGKQAVLRMQLVDFLREVVEQNGEDALPVPPMPGATPAEGWGRKDDQAMLLSAFRHGYGAWFDELGADGYKREADLDELASRLVKLVMSIVKRSQVAAKLAMHEASTAARTASARPKSARRARRRGADSASDEEPSDDDAGDIDDDQFIADPDDAPAAKATRRTRRVKLSGELASMAGSKEVSNTTSVFWSKRDQQEFVQVVRGYGLPAQPDPAASRSWTIFAQLGAFSPRILEAAPSSFEEFAPIFLAACERAASMRKRRRTKQEIAKGASVEEDEEPIPGELVAADEVEEGQDLVEEEPNAVDGVFTVSPILNSTRAKLLLETISLLDTLRTDPVLLALSTPELEQALNRARRLSILPRWWRAGIHDAAMLRAVAMYGLERPDLIIAGFPVFRETLKDLGKIRTLSAKEKKAKPEEKKSDDTLPRLADDEELAWNLSTDWPTLVNLIGRLRKMYEMATGSAASTSVNLDFVDELSDEGAPSAPSKRKAKQPARKASPTKKRKPAAKKDDEDDGELD